jgi:hypothetical protein
VATRPPVPAVMLGPAGDRQQAIAATFGGIRGDLGGGRPVNCRQRARRLPRSLGMPT